MRLGEVRVALVKKEHKGLGMQMTRVASRKLAW